ncbi:MAG: hypothetical protein ACYTBS_28135, partial [Planctomycetota bacterium]
VSVLLTNDYESRPTSGVGKNKPNLSARDQTQLRALGGKLEALSSEHWIPAFAGMTKHGCEKTKPIL